MPYIAPNGGNITLVMGGSYTPPSGGSITLIFPAIASSEASIVAVSGCSADSAALVSSEVLIAAEAAFLPVVGLRHLSRAIGQMKSRLRGRSATFGASHLAISGAINLRPVGGSVCPSEVNITATSNLAPGIGTIESGAASIDGVSVVDGRGGSVTGGRALIGAALTTSGEGSYTTVPDTPRPDVEITVIVSVENLYVR